MDDGQPMEIDPIDGGPKSMGAPPPPEAMEMSPPPVAATSIVAISEEDEARQAIDMLRGDDVSSRVAAANRLEAVAAALGEERTRDVRLRMGKPGLRLRAIRLLYQAICNVSPISFCTGTLAFLN